MSLTCSVDPIMDESEDQEYLLLETEKEGLAARYPVETSVGEVDLGAGPLSQHGMTMRFNYPPEPRAIAP